MRTLTDLPVHRSIITFRLIRQELAIWSSGASYENTFCSYRSNPFHMSKFHLLITLFIAKSRTMLRAVLTDALVRFVPSIFICHLRRGMLLKLDMDSWYGMESLGVVYIFWLTYTLHPFSLSLWAAQPTWMRRVQFGVRRGHLHKSGHVFGVPSAFSEHYDYYCTSSWHLSYCSGWRRRVWMSDSPWAWCHHSPSRCRT